MGAAARTTDAFWMRCFGLLERRHPGGINCPAVQVYLHDRGPPELGNWRTAHFRFRRWTSAGIRESLFNALTENPDFEYVLIDATISKVHADAAGQKGGLTRCLTGECTAIAETQQNPRQC